MACRSRELGLICAGLLLLLATRVQVQAPSLDSQLRDAAGTGDVKAVSELLAKGGNIDAENWRGATLLCSAAEHGYVEIVKLLIDRGADVNARDLEWGRTPLINASVPPSDEQHRQAATRIIGLLLEKGAGAEGESPVDLIRRGQTDAARTIIGRGSVFPSYLNLALGAARRVQQPSLVDALIKAGAKDPGPMDSPLSPARLNVIAGRYRNASGQELIVHPALSDDQVDVNDVSQRSLNQWLILERAGQPNVRLSPIDLTFFRSQDMNVVVRLKDSALPPAELTLIRRDSVPRSSVFMRIGDAPRSTVASPSSRPPGLARRPLPRTIPATVASREWPAFRGPGASGVMDGAHPPATWDLTRHINIKWTTPIPGLGHSSPVVWGERVFITTAVASGDTFFLAGPQASSTAASANRSTRDDVVHSWRVYALDKQSGSILWERVAHEGVPRSARHVMESQANSTPATDGTHLVVFFGSEGLYCYDVQGKLLWQKDLGKLRSGYVMDPTYEWNTASSPVIYKNLVFLQVDLVEGSFIAAFNVTTGAQVWRTERDELPSWATPFIYEGPKRVELITLATKFARGYDPITGKELWRLGKHSTHATPTPIAGHGLIFLSSGSGNTIQPIYAMLPGAQGNITLGDDETSNEFVIWSTPRGGSSRATPILYGDLLYVNSDPGVLSAYDPENGKRLYQHRLPLGGGNEFTASPVAADGRIYYPTADGDVVVVKAGPTFEEEPVVNPMGEPILASPAISQGMILFRMQHHLVAVADSPPK